MTKKILSGFLMLAALAFLNVGKASATIAVATSVSTTSAVLVATPTVSGQVNVLRSVNFCNDTDTATCVFVSNNEILKAGGVAGGGTLMLSVCAAAHTCSSSPALASANQQQITDGLAGFLGERMNFTGAIELTSGAAQTYSSGPGGLTVTYDYYSPPLR